MFKLFKKKNSSTKITKEEFWDWFLNHQSDLEKFIDSKGYDYLIYNQLTKEIKKYNHILCPELTKTKEDKYVLIITPDGIKEGVQPTKDLAEDHPEIENWIIKKFRQPTNKIQLNFNGVEYPSSDIEIYPEIVKDEEKVDIQVYIKNMNKDEKKYQSLAFLYLDHIIGEFNTITKVRTIDFYTLEENKMVENSISILELRKLIENELY